MPTPPKRKPAIAPVGAQGETLCAAHLERLGWTILARNFRCPQGELDIIAREPTQPEPTLVFVEVKTRRGQAHGSPLASVDARKQQKLSDVAHVWLGRQGAAEGAALLPEPLCRFDVAEVFVNAQGLSQIVLHRGVFSQ